MLNSKGTLCGLVVNSLSTSRTGSGPAVDQKVDAKFQALVSQKLEKHMVLKIVRPVVISFLCKRIHFKICGF